MKNPGLIQVQLLSLSGEDQYRLSCFRPVDSLIQSLKCIGQTVPLLCRETTTGYELFSGFLRREAMLALGRENASALAWKEDQLSELEAFRVAFFENACSRGLNLAEMAKAAGRLKGFGLADREIALDYFQQAGLAGSVKNIGLLERFWTLDWDWKKYLTEKEFCLRHLSWFLNLPEPDQNELKILLRLKPTSSQFREMLEMMEEVCQRDRMPVARLLAALGGAAILKEGKGNLPQQLKLLINALRKIRYPEWDKLFSRHQKILRNLEIPGPVTLEPVDFFEQPKYRLELILGRDTDAKKILEKLLQAASGPDWEKLFKPDDD